MANIEFNNVSYEEKGTVFLNNISLNIDQGELFMIRSSDLKEATSLLYLIHDLIRPSSGEVKISFEDNLGWVGSNCIPMISECTVKEALSLPLLCKKISKKEIEEKIEEVSLYFSIDPLLKKRVKELTPAEYALVAVSKAIIGEPSLVLLQPFSHLLDHKIAVLIMTYLHEISVDYKVTVVMVENDTRLHPFAGKILHLEKGAIKDLLGEGIDLQKLMPFLKI